MQYADRLARTAFSEKPESVEDGCYYFSHDRTSIVYEAREITREEYETLRKFIYVEDE